MLRRTAVAPVYSKDARVFSEHKTPSPSRPSNTKGLMNWPKYDAESLTNFWQKVAGTGRYGQESQTWQWPEELERVEQVVKAERPEVLVSYGCADGCRDPYQPFTEPRADC